MHPDDNAFADPSLSQGNPMMRRPMPEAQMPSVPDMGGGGPPDDEMGEMGMDGGLDGPEQGEPGEGQFGMTPPPTPLNQMPIASFDPMQSPFVLTALLKQMMQPPPMPGMGQQGIPGDGSQPSGNAFMDQRPQQPQRDQFS
jgi:hypothetical protein